MYSLRLLLRSWGVILLLVTFSIIFFWYLTNLNILNFKQILIICIVEMVAVNLALMIMERNKARRNFYDIYIGPCYTAKENDYLFTDLEAAHINVQIEKIVQGFTKDSTAYKLKIITLELFNIPKFLPALLGYERFNKFLERKAQTRAQLSSIYFIKSISDENLVAKVYFNNSKFANPLPLDYCEELINTINNEKNLAGNMKVDLILTIYMLALSLCYVDHIINDNFHQELMFMLQDVERNIVSVKDKSHLVSEISKQKILNFCAYWLGFTTRLKSISMFKQKLIIPALESIFKSIHQNPYFPYNNYETLKFDFTYKYIIQILPYVEEAYIAFPEQDSQVKLDSIRNAIDKLKNKVKAVETGYNYETVKSIIRDNLNDDVIKYLEECLAELDPNNPFHLMTRCEIQKHIPKGESIIDAIYVEQLPLCINLLQEILIIDNNFPVIWAKIGTFQGMLAYVNSDTELELESNKNIMKGFQYLSEGGIHFN